MTIHKAVFAAASEVTDEDKGLVDALVSATEVRYSITPDKDHTIKAGAFLGVEGRTIPLYAEHQWGIPHGHGVLSEHDDGLHVAEQYYLDTEAGRSMFRAVKSGAIRERSIGYIVAAATADPNDPKHDFVSEVEVLESSNVLKGANPHTKTLQVASQAPDVVEQQLDLEPDPTPAPTVDVGYAAGRSWWREICGPGPQLPNNEEIHNVE